MAGRDMQIPFGPVKTGGWGIEPIAPEGEQGSLGEAEPRPLSEALPCAMSASLPETAPDPVPAKPARGLSNVAEAEPQPPSRPLAPFDKLLQFAPVQGLSSIVLSGR